MRLVCGDVWEGEGKRRVASQFTFIHVRGRKPPLGSGRKGPW